MERVQRVKGGPHARQDHPAEASLGEATLEAIQQLKQVYGCELTAADGNLKERLENISKSTIIPDDHFTLPTPSTSE